MSLLYQMARRIYGDYHEKQSSLKGVVLLTNGDRCQGFQVGVNPILTAGSLTGKLQVKEVGFFCSFFSSLSLQNSNPPLNQIYLPNNHKHKTKRKGNTCLCMREGGCRGSGGSWLEGTSTFLWREGETNGCTILFHDFQEMAGLSKSLTRSRDRAVNGKTAVFGLPQGRAKSH